MQSQLEAALLGQTSTALPIAPIDDDQSTIHDEEPDDVEEFVDEDIEGDTGQRVGKHVYGNCTSRTVTLQMLLNADILQPGNGTMAIEYLGQRFVGDLLEDGKIRSQETDIVFASPSAWAIACKRFINPEKKSGCGWASVKYRGKKLDAYKVLYYKKKNEERQDSDSVSEVEILSQINMTAPMHYHRVAVKHNTVANRTLTHDANTLIECVPFSTIGKIQPFLVSLSTNAALLMDFHCHLTKSEVSGYLAGHWDVNTHNLEVTHAFPCRNTKTDRENALQVESEIAKCIEKENLTLVGWYHSHPYAAASPTLRDVDSQLDYQIRMKGPTDNNYTPCIGIIISPYNVDNTSLESNIVAYWVVPPPEMKPNEYGRPMLMSYSVVQDAEMGQGVKDELAKCVNYYKKELDYVNFADQYANGTLYIEKLKSSLVSKFPRDESETVLWRFIREALSYHQEEADCLLSIPSLKSSAQYANLNSSITSNLMLPSDISSLLFNAGKFPTASSLLGLPDPMAHSTLAANNMFLSTNLFKMQELLKPLGTSSPKTGKSESKVSTLKIPSDLKAKADYNTDLLNLKNQMEFIAPGGSKGDFGVADLSKGGLVDFSLSFGKDLGEKASKVAKMDCSSLDLSMGKILDREAQRDFGMEEDKPLNLATE